MKNVGVCSIIFLTGGNFLLFIEEFLYNFDLKNSRIVWVFQTHKDRNAQGNLKEKESEKKREYIIHLAKKENFDELFDKCKKNNKADMGISNKPLPLPE